MEAFRVKVRTLTQSLFFYALGQSSAVVHKNAEDRFDGPCGIAVIPLKKEQACH